MAVTKNGIIVPNGMEGPFGMIHAAAQERMALINEGIAQRREAYVPFPSQQECADFAKAHNIDNLLLERNSNRFLHINHTGESLAHEAFIRQYGDILQYIITNSKGKEKIVQWDMRGPYADRARIIGEKRDGLRLPMYHRNHFQPFGYFDPMLGTFNRATPFSCFADRTGRDTSHIYTYLKALAGECYMHILAWLRAKLINPHAKIGIMPIFTSRAQGTGKSTFGEVICKALFGGSKNVAVTDQHDMNARFATEFVNLLILMLEESEYTDGKGATAQFKSRITATEVRVEYKGKDAYFQAFYCDYLMCSNKAVPMKYDDEADQRRFMNAMTDETFQWKTNPDAYEVFTKLYGCDPRTRQRIKDCLPMTEDKELVQQFMYELLTREDIAAIDLYNFPKTEAYYRCRTLPRTNEAVNIESQIHSLVPFVKASLEAKKVVDSITLNKGTEYEETLKLSNFLPTVSAMQYIKAADGTGYVALCESIAFVDPRTSLPLNHATVQRTLFDSYNMLALEGLRIRSIEHLPGGFYGVHSAHRNSYAICFELIHEPAEIVTPEPTVSKVSTPLYPKPEPTTLKPKRVPKAETTFSAPEPEVVALAAQRIGQKLRVNSRWQVDPRGEYETLNEMQPGVTTLENKNRNVQYMDTFLFEADEADAIVEQLEKNRAERLKIKKKLGELNMGVKATVMFSERLAVQVAEYKRLMDEGIACRAVFSGGKSIHILVRVKDAPDTLEEYKWLHAYLATHLSDKLKFDPSTSDPARLTRAPVSIPRTFQFEGIKILDEQRLLRDAPQNVYDIKWRALYQQWLDRPLSPIEKVRGRRLMPMKQEYKDAATALLSATFWTDKKWNGQRQQCFFPAYRICRMQGFSHDELWGPDGILDGLERYYRADERNYWRTRKDCALIAQIDRDIDMMEEERDGNT